jgi:hypothetical protein
MYQRGVVRARLVIRKNAVATFPTDATNVKITFQLEETPKLEPALPTHLWPNLQSLSLTSKTGGFKFALFPFLRTLPSSLTSLKMRDEYPRGGHPSHGWGVCGDALSRLLSSHLPNLAALKLLSHSVKFKPDDEKCEWPAHLSTLRLMLDMSWSPYETETAHLDMPPSITSLSLTLTSQRYCPHTTVKSSSLPPGLLELVADYIHFDYDAPIPPMMRRLRVNWSDPGFGKSPFQLPSTLTALYPVIKDDLASCASNIRVVVRKGSHASLASLSEASTREWEKYESLTSAQSLLRIGTIAHAFFRPTTWDFRGEALSETFNNVPGLLCQFMARVGKTLRVAENVGDEALIEELLLNAKWLTTLHLSSSRSTIAFFRFALGLVRLQDSRSFRMPHLLESLDISLDVPSIILLMSCSDEFSPVQYESVRTLKYSLVLVPFEHDEGISKLLTRMFPRAQHFIKSRKVVAPLEVVD